MAQSEAAVRFVLDGEVVTVGAMPATTTLLGYLREQKDCTAVKEGCAEGDCGACTVALGELEGQTITWRAINACLRLLPTCDGKEVVTSKGLAAGGTLHPVQQAMVDCHGSQCGFCTPGFVMSLFAQYMAKGPHEMDRPGLVRALSGNLCRCTGYRPIIDAGLALGDYPEPACWNRADGVAPERVARLQSLQRAEGLELADFHAPRSLAEFAAAYAARPDSLILAGGTDIGLWVTKQLRELPPLLYIGDVAELQSIDRQDGQLVIGAAVRLEEAFAALVQAYPQLDDLAQRFASLPIRNAGTLCGNVANGSPIGDAMPALIALGATVCLRRGVTAREIPLEELYLGYQKKDLSPGEFVEAVRIPLPRPEIRFALYKVSKRFDQDISAVCAGMAVTLEDGKVTGARIAFGGMAATPKRATLAEQVLVGQDWSAATVASAVKAVAGDYAPLSDMRASSAYRSAVAANLLWRFWHESQGAACRLETLAPVASVREVAP